MTFTKEQQAIINSIGDIKINAVAGSGKTTTVIEYAKARYKSSKILYLAFNKSVKVEAQNKFRNAGLNNVHIETAHSLAFKHIMYGSKFKINSQGYKSYEIAELLNLQNTGEKHIEFILSNHINQFTAYFCNSAVKKVQDLNYLDVVVDNKAKTFVHNYYKQIEKGTREFLAKMHKAQVDITHDFYLKQFQLRHPQLGYDYILFDEGQDASPAMLDVFLKQSCTKVIVGDAHQQIYGWRYAVNSLDKVKFKTYNLSTSFRFNSHTAQLASETLQWKNHLIDYKPISIKGKGMSSDNKSKAVLARTNLGLLVRAIEMIGSTKNLKNIYFEGNINSYTYADDGASLYDILNLYNGKRKGIRDILIKQMKDFGELEEYVENTGDLQLGLMISIVKDYGSEIPNLIKQIKAKHIDGDHKENASYIFSTVHRCKGMEYDSVTLVNDFINEEKLEKLVEDSNEKEAEKLDIAKLNEEINLLYVAITRSKNLVFIPENLVPKNFRESENIKIIKEDDEGEPKDIKIKMVKREDGTWERIVQRVSKRTIIARAQAKNNPLKANKAVNNKAYSKWTKELDEELTKLFCEGTNIKIIANHFTRTPSAIRARIKKLELIEKYGWPL